MDWQERAAAFSKAANTLLLYSGITKDPVISSVLDFAGSAADGRGEIFSPAASICLRGAMSALVEKAEEFGLSGDIYRKYVIKAVLDDENVFSLACERGAPNKDTSLYRLALLDMQRVIEILNFDFAALCKEAGYTESLACYVPAEACADAYADHISALYNAEDALTAVTLYYGAMGCGIMARYKAFRFDGGGLVGVKHCDPALLSDIVGYAEQKRAIVENTKSFLDGKPANNVLLVGARGTGKSSCVKALYNEYHAKGLRVVEVTKDNLEYLPRLVNILRRRGKKFILFIDDLSFDDFEAQYKHMKSLIEGGVEETPKNVLFYATSNRRHIIAEKWDDKNGAVIEEGEVHPSDTVNEKLSLSDRFGLTVSFDRPAYPAYINIVLELAGKLGLDIDDESLAQQARQWEMANHGLSGRTAKQFVNHLACELYR